MNILRKAIFNFILYYFIRIEKLAMSLEEKNYKIRNIFLQNEDSISYPPKKQFINNIDIYDNLNNQPLSSNNQILIKKGIEIFKHDDNLNENNIGEKNNASIKNNKLTKVKIKKKKKIIKRKKSYKINENDKQIQQNIEERKIAYINTNEMSKNEKKMKLKKMITFLIILIIIKINH